MSHIFTPPQAPVHYPVQYLSSLTDKWGQQRLVPRGVRPSRGVYTPWLAWTGATRIRVSPNESAVDGGEAAYFNLRRKSRPPKHCRTKLKGVNTAMTMTSAEIAEMTKVAHEKECRLKAISDRAIEIASTFRSMTADQQIAAEQEVNELRKEKAELNKYIADVKAKRAQFFASASVA